MSARTARWNGCRARPSALERKLLSRDRHRPAARRLSVHRVESRRGSAGQAPHRRRHARPICRRQRWQRAGLDEQQKLERLVDEYAQADGLDRRRRDRLAELIVEDRRKRRASPPEAGVAATDAPDEALRRIDAWLCDLKDFAIKDGLHVYGRAPERASRSAAKAPQAERDGADRRA